MVDRRIAFMPYFQPAPMSEILTMTNLQHTVSRVWICTESEFRLCWMKFCSSDNHYITAPFTWSSNQLPKHQLYQVKSGVFLFYSYNQLRLRHWKVRLQQLGDRSFYRNQQHWREDNGCPKNALVTKRSTMLLGKFKMYRLFKNKVFLCFQQLTDLNRSCGEWGWGRKTAVLQAKSTFLQTLWDHITPYNTFFRKMLPFYLEKTNFLALCSK